MPKGAHRFRINYKSGQSVEVTADKLSVKRSTVSDEPLEMTWQNLDPHPLYLGLSAIESVWQVS